jgi:DNA-binding beta-propeller fold protein YncE
MILSPDGETFYTVESGTNGSDYVAAINRATGKSIRAFKTKFPPSGALAILPNQSEIYVATCNPNATLNCDGYVEVLNIASGEESTAIAMGDDLVAQIAAAPNGATVYGVHYSNSTCPGCETRPGIQPAAAPADSVPSGTLTAIDVASLQVGTSLGLGTAQLPAAVAITQDSKYAYVLGTEIALLNTTVNGVYLPNMTLGATISVAGCVGTSIAVSPGGSHGGHGIQLRQRSIRFCIRR